MSNATFEGVIGRLERLEEGLRKLQQGYEAFLKRKGADRVWERVTRLSLPILGGLVIAAGAMILRHDNLLGRMEESHVTREEAYDLERKFSAALFALPQIQRDISEIKRQSKTDLAEIKQRLRALEQK